MQWHSIRASKGSSACLENWNWKWFLSLHLKQYSIIKTLSSLLTSILYINAVFRPQSIIVSGSRINPHFTTVSLKSLQVSVLKLCPCAINNGLSLSNWDLCSFFCLFKHAHGEKPLVLVGNLTGDNSARLAATSSAFTALRSVRWK